MYYLFGYPDGPIVVTFVIALQAVAAEGLLWRTAVLGVAAMLAMTISEVVSGFRNFASIPTFLLAGWIVAVVALGSMRYSRAAERHEAARRMAAVEQAGAERERRLASEERLRIARELHDALGHHISLISVQATAALHSLSRPARLPTTEPAVAFDAIKDASGKALRDLGVVLDILRQRDHAAHTTGLDQLDALVENIRSVGLDVRTDVEPAPRPLPQEINLAVYRIVQEALTNTTRHAKASSVDIVVRYRGGELELDVRDNGTSGGTSEGGRRNPGNGVRGMAERASSVGGWCVAGPAPDSGFLVHARLPLDTSR